MNYYLDTEFIEGPQTKRLFGFPIGKTKPTIDLISIALVAEDGREYYAISRDFNLREAWERYDLKECYGIGFCQSPNDNGQCSRQEKCEDQKVFWLRENVLYPIFCDLFERRARSRLKENWDPITGKPYYADIYEFTLENLRLLINAYGKSNAEIAEDIKNFVRVPNATDEPMANQMVRDDNIQFYTYYGAYDWVVFCWLFELMKDLPDGFPMYSRDLKQMLDEKAVTLQERFTMEDGSPLYTFNNALHVIMRHFPKPKGEHVAINDARYARDLHNYLKSIK